MFNRHKLNTKNTKSMDGKGYIKAQTWSEMCCGGGGGRLGGQIERWELVE